MNGENLKNTVLAVLSAIGAFGINACGGFDALLKCLIVFMIVDYLTGFGVAFVFRKSLKTPLGGASSAIGFKGIVKKICMLTLVALAFCIDTLIGKEYIRCVTILFFIGNEGLSILENMALMGVRYPKKLLKALEVMRDKGDKEE